MRKLSKIAGILLLGMIFFHGCGEEKAAGPTLVVAQGADAKSLDPHATNDQPSAAVAIQIYNTLVEQDNDKNITPSLAESWTRPDARTTVFKLRRGVKFHNGEELKASDVKFTLERALESPQVNFIVETVSEIETPDDYTVVIRTEKPFAGILSHLSHNAVSILSEKAVKAAGAAYGEHPVGTGPFKFESWQSGDRIVLSANENYFAGPPAVKQLIFRNIPENAARAIALEAGEIGIAYGIDVTDKERLMANPKIDYYEGPSLSTTYVGFNARKAPLDDLRVRQAICSAIDIDPMIDAVFKAGAVKANSLIPPNVFGYSKTAKAWNRDVEKGKALLAEAGYPDGLKVSLWTNDNQQRRDIAVIMQAQLKDIGVDMTIEVVDWGAFLDLTGRGEHEMYILGWGTVTADADYGLAPLVHTDNMGGAGNRSFYSNPAVDNLLDEAKTETDEDKRAALYAKVQDIIQEEVPVYPIAYGNTSAAALKTVKGFTLRATGSHRLYGVSLAQ